MRLLLLSLVLALSSGALAQVPVPSSPEPDERRPLIEEAPAELDQLQRLIRENPPDPGDLRRLIDESPELGRLLECLGMGNEPRRRTRRCRPTFGAGVGGSDEAWELSLLVSSPVSPAEGG